MNDAQPKDKYTALIYGAVAAVLTLIVAFGAPVSEDQKWAILAAIAPVVAIVQAIITRTSTTDNAVVVAKAKPGVPEAVAADASVYPNGTQLQTVPATLNPSEQLDLLTGEVKPRTR